MSGRHSSLPLLWRPPSDPCKERRRPAAGGSGTLTYRSEFRSNWPTLLGAGIGLTFGTALNFYVLSLFGPALIAEFGWSRADFALSGTFPLLTMAFVPVAGAFVDRFGPVSSAAVGYVAVTLGHVAMTFLTGSITEFFVIYTLQAGLGILTTTMVFCRVVVERFDNARGIALSFVMSAPPLAGMVAAPVLGSVIEGYGWRAGYWSMAGLSAIGGLATLPLIGRRKPSADPRPREERPRLGRQELLSLLRNPILLLIMAGIFLVNIPQVFASSQIKLVVMDRGVGSEAAIWLVSVYAMGVVLGRLLSGLALDRVQPHIVAVAALGLPMIGFLILASQVAAVGLLVFAIVLIGLAQGAESDIGAYLISRRFDAGRFSLLLGLVTTTMSLGSVCGAFVLSLSLRESDSYTRFMLVSAVATLIGAALFGLTGVVGRHVHRCNDLNVSANETM